MKAMYGPTASYCKMPGNKGVTAFAIIETSHIAMHIWDEPNPALVQLDVYSCAPLDPEKVLPFLNQMDPVKIDYKFLDRETEFKDLLVTDK
jgi:S-adenosylmethionine/arginine decarboxylase-like enzyme